MHLYPELYILRYHLRQSGTKIIVPVYTVEHYRQFALMCNFGRLEFEFVSLPVALRPLDAESVQSEQNTQSSGNDLNATRDEDTLRTLSPLVVLNATRDEDTLRTLSDEDALRTLSDEDALRTLSPLVVLNATRDEDVLRTLLASVDLSGSKDRSELNTTKDRSDLSPFVPLSDLSHNVDTRNLRERDILSSIDERDTSDIMIEGDRSDTDLEYNLTFHGLSFDVNIIDRYSTEINDFPVPLPLSILLHRGSKVPYQPLQPLYPQGLDIWKKVSDTNAKLYNSGTLFLDCEGNNCAQVVELILYLFSKGYYFEPLFYLGKSAIPILNILEPGKPLVTKNRGETCEFIEHLQATITELDE